MTGVIAGCFIAEAAGAPMRACAAVIVVPGVGIPGDRYATGQGHWSDPRWPDQQLTLMEEELAGELGVGPAQLRRNLVTSGIPLESLIGVTFTVGTATLRGVRACDPCRYIETLTRPGLFEELAGRGGLRAEIIAGGRIAIGDSIAAVPRTEASPIS